MFTQLLSRAGSNKEAGLLPKAANALDIDKAYKEHVMQSIDEGKEPMEKEEFKKSRASL
jgi:hypothetical protein